jgi:hypothetical protein
LRRARDQAVGADDRIRTGDLLITNQLLYQLSYVGLTSLDQKRSYFEASGNCYAGVFWRKSLLSLVV